MGLGLVGQLSKKRDFAHKAVTRHPMLWTVKLDKSFLTRSRFRSCISNHTVLDLHPRKECRNFCRYRCHSYRRARHSIAANLVEEGGMSVIVDLQPKQLWQHFETLSKIPRPSKHEEKYTHVLRI